ncbi:MAG: glycosyltransferase family 4 protein [Allorhizobium sp.]
MKLLHITPHLGGGVGKAHAAIQAASSPYVRRTYCLLEQPRDRRYADLIEAAGATLTTANEPAHLAALIDDADIVQIEWWNHPRLYQLLATGHLPAMRTVFWSHVSGLFPPYIPAALMERAGCFLFTSPCSLESASLSRLSAPARQRLGVVGSGFGFEEATGAALQNPATEIVYLGTVDFVKMHPAFFDIIDAVAGPEFQVSIWGGFEPDGEAARKAAAMAHPARVVFKGQTADPRAILENAGIFFYPLRDDHYGTAENALIEAMSLGAVPLVMDNPAERAIVTDGETGLVATDVADAARKLRLLLDDPARLARLGDNAMRHSRAHFRPEKSADALEGYYRQLMDTPKSVIDFGTVLGHTPAEWFLSTQSADGTLDVSAKFSPGALLAKGSIAHFLATFPDDRGLLDLCAVSARPAPGR